MAGWTRVEQILAYQRSLELRDKVLALIDAGAIPHNFHLRDQISDAARSAPANIHEGFDRYKHGQFGYYVAVAKASLAELGTHLDEVRKRGFASKKVLDDLFALSSEAYRLTCGLLRHLETTDAPPPWLKPDDSPSARGAADDARGVPSTDTPITSRGGTSITDPRPTPTTKDGVLRTDHGEH